MKVKLIKKHKSLTLNKCYYVIGIEADDFRILNDSNEPYLYSPKLFKIIDFSKPTNWIIEYGEDGEEYAYPFPLNEAGFFEDFFDDNLETQKTFWDYMNMIKKK